MNSKNINKILQELYQIDESLQEKEEEVKQALQDLIEHRPEIKIDEDFVHELRQKLETETKSKTSKQFKPYLIHTFVIAGAACVIGVLMFFPWQQDKEEIEVFNQNYDNLKVSQTQDNAFGSLSQVDLSETSDSNSATNMEGGNSEVSGLGEEDYQASSPDAVASQPRITHSPVRYKIVYEGEEFQPEENKLPVYKKMQAETNNSNLASVVSSLDFNFIELDNFSNLKVKNINLTQEGEFAYNIQLNLKNNTVNIYKNWDTWPNIREKCDNDRECITEKRLSIDDVPQDKKIKQVANNFIDKHNIGLDPYQDPIIRKRWSEDPLEEESRFISDNIKVVYPLNIEGQTVFSQSGQEQGLEVSVNIRHMKVSSVRGLEPKLYESSKYEVETDQDKIIEMTKQERETERRYFNKTEQEVKEEKVIIGTPELKLVSIRKYDRDTRNSQELLIPAYVFPVKEKSSYYRDYITVPIVQDLLDKKSSGNPSIEPRVLETED